MTKFIGWSAVLMIVIATVIRAFDYSNILDLTFTFLGSIFWTCDGILTRNKPLAVVSAFCVAVVGFGIVRYMII